MFVLLRLILSCLARPMAFPGAGVRLLLSMLQTRKTGPLAAIAHTLSLALIHTPTPRLSS